MPWNRFFPGLRRALRLTHLLTLTICGLLLATPWALAQTYSVVHSFKGPPDGKYPKSILTRDKNGNLFGTTTRGGVSYGGMAFKLDSNGKETTLYNFDAGYGAGPIGGMARNKKGNLYGATQSGGAYGWGAVFKLNKSGNETVLHSFDASAGDGATPYSGPIRDASGNLYGTTALGGTSKNGIVYKIDSKGKETILHRFTGGSDGSNPYGGLVRDSEGNLYGTTGFGGNCGGGYCGEVFKIDATGNLTVLYGFTGKGGDGNFAFAGVTRDPNGNLYGTTYYGGNLQCGDPYLPGCGIVFKLDPAGNETVLYAFSGTDGANPAGGVVLDAAGNLYGTTWGGGDYGAGVVFKLDESGNLTVLHSFAGPPDGDLPAAGVFLDTTGSIYGTTQEGGAYGWGIVYKLVP